MSCKTIINENKAYWSQRASSYSEVNQDELSGENREYWSKILCHEIDYRIPKNRAETRILEIGTGPGFFAIIMAEAGYNVTAIDLTPNMLAEARKNAGALAEKIDFREMNAEALEFDDSSFDVIISRNLTWNLPHPEKAYAEWCRVLKSGGAILNFDANWYSYLYNEEAKLAYHQDRRNAAESGFKDQNVGENFDVMEDIARRVPLSAIQRPAWDVGVLSCLGMSVNVDENVWQRVWSSAEQTMFASTPMFMINAVKPA